MSFSLKEIPIRDQYYKKNNVQIWQHKIYISSNFI